MLRLIPVFGAVAVVAFLAAGAARADGIVSLGSQPADTYYFDFQSNWAGFPGYPSAPQLFEGNSSTLWNAPLNATLLWRGTSLSSWATIATLLLNDQDDLSGGLTLPPGHATGFDEPSAYDFGNWGYAGYFVDESGYHSGSTYYRPAHSSYQIGVGEYYLPNSASLSEGTMQFELQVWSGSSSTYAGDTNPADWVAQSPAFTPTGSMGQEGTIEIPSTANFCNMPDLILQHPVPEPSTILLTASGLAGLLAYAWRRRK
jgi:hypothetical protein